MRLLAQVVLDDVLAPFAVRRVHDERAVEPAGTRERRIEHVGAVRRADDEDERLRRHRPADQSKPSRDLDFETVFDVLTKRVHLVEERVETHALAAEHAHPAHTALHLSALNPAAGKPDRVKLVHEEDAAAGRPGLRVFARESPTLPKERNDDERVDAHPHASQA